MNLNSYNISNLNELLLSYNYNTTDNSYYDFNNTNIDINLKYNLHIIVPILWSLIICIGVLGMFN